MLGSIDKCHVVVGHNTFKVSVLLRSYTPRFPLRSLAEEYAERLSNIVINYVTRLSHLESGGHIGYHQPASCTSVTMKGMLESTPSSIRDVRGGPSKA
ncbi:hypothetical protein CsSME_00004252 [Camellia sinensis var. sinensis]